MKLFKSRIWHTEFAFVNVLYAKGLRSVYEVGTHRWSNVICQEDLTLHVPSPPRSSRTRLGQLQSRRLRRWRRGPRLLHVHSREKDRAVRCRPAAAQEHRGSRLAELWEPTDRVASLVQGVMMFWYLDILIFLCFDNLICWHFDVLVFWYFDLFLYLHSLILWYAGMGISWYFDSLVGWHVGCLNIW